MTVKEGCLLLGMALLRINDAASLAAWASNKGRFDEADGFLLFAEKDIAEALAGNYIVPEQAEEMRRCIRDHTQAVQTGNREGAQDALAELSLKSFNVAFNRVVECECGRKQ